MKRSNATADEEEAKSEQKQNSAGEVIAVDVEECGDESELNKHRLQRQKAQSRKTFRFRKSRRGLGKDDKMMVDENQPLDSPDDQIKSQTSLSPPEQSGFDQSNIEEKSGVFTIPYKE